MKTKDSMIFNYVKNIIKNITGEYNEDLEQEAYLKLWKNSDKYQDKGSLKAWVRTVTANVTRDYLRSSQAKTAAQCISNDDEILQIKDNSPSPELKIIQKQRQKTIISAINTLKPKFKEIIILYEIEDNSYEEIAQKLKCPIGTVKSRLYNAKKELAALLQEEGLLE